MADAAIILKRHDTWPPVQATLTDSGGPIDLTSAVSVEFIMKGMTSSTLVTGACTVVTPLSGLVQYAWAIGDTAIADSYQVEFEITWDVGPPAKTQTVPSSLAGDQVIQIDPDLENL